MAVAFLALFLAVSGTATAAKLITGKNIARSTITGKHVKDHSLSSADFRGSVAGAPGPQGPQGPAGPKGATGAKGERGPQGDRGIQGERGSQGERGFPGEDGKDGTNGEDGKDGTNGTNGTNGTDGEDGKDGKDGFGGINVQSRSLTIPGDSLGSTTVTCPPTHPRVVGGGIQANSRHRDVQDVSSYPSSTSAWTVQVKNQSFGFTAGDVVTTAYAICVAG